MSKLCFLAKFGLFFNCSPSRDQKSKFLKLAETKPMFLYTNFACSFHWDMWQHGTLAFMDSNCMIFKKGDKNQENFDPKSHHTHFIFAQIHNLVPDMKNLYNFALANYFKCQKLDLICPNQICQIKSLFCSFLPVEPQVGLTQPTFYTTYTSQWRLPMG